jgi:hypothetical protein
MCSEFPEKIEVPPHMNWPIHHSISMSQHWHCFCFWQFNKDFSVILLSVIQCYTINYRQCTINYTNVKLNYILYMPELPVFKNRCLLIEWELHPCFKCRPSKILKNVLLKSCILYFISVHFPQLLYMIAMFRL